VKIENAGTFWIDGIDRYADIVCSPKTPTIHPMIYSNAMAFKYVLSSYSQLFDHGEFGYVPIAATQPGSRSARLALPNPEALIYLSPCDEQDEEKNRVNRRLVGRLAIKYGVLAGLQMHKYLELE
jgi:7-carboxy-7-deazaguanine synthase